MDWPIQEIARLTGTTSRTLRHYDDIGLLAPSRTGSNGYRYYDERALVRLQRILMLRDIGLGIPAIAEVLDAGQDDRDALGHHLDWLHQERDRIDRQIASVVTTITTMEGGEQLMAENMFDGFDHTRYQDEVTQRWGAQAYADGDRWWRSMSAEERADWKARLDQLTTDWTDAAERGIPADGEEAQALAARHAAWLESIPGTPGAGSGQSDAAYLLGLADMYVADDRFAANYGGTDGARFVRDAVRAYVARRP